MGYGADSCAKTGSVNRAKEKNLTLAPVCAPTQKGTVVRRCGRKSSLSLAHSRGGKTPKWPLMINDQSRRCLINVCWMHEYINTSPLPLIKSDLNEYWVAEAPMSCPRPSYLASLLPAPLHAAGALTPVALMPVTRQPRQGSERKWRRPKAGSAQLWRLLGPSSLLQS